MRDLGLLLLRIVAGLTLAADGYPKPLLGAAALSLGLTGSGRISIDHLISSKDS